MKLMIPSINTCKHIGGSRSLVVVCTPQTFPESGKRAIFFIFTPLRRKFNVAACKGQKNLSTRDRLLPKEIIFACFILPLACGQFQIMKKQKFSVVCF
jgi:hypothetical protein